jgi:hypothetical protein
MSTKRNFNNNKKGKGKPNKRKTLNKAPARNSRRNEMTNPMQGPMPTIYRTTLKYVETLDVNLSANIVTSYEFRTNSVYDPNYTGGGHQPLGFDEISTFYNKYRVLGFRYHVSAPIIPNSTTGQNVTVGALIANGAYTLSLPSAQELPFSKFYSAGAPSPGVHLRGGMDLTKIAAHREEYKIDDRFAALINGSPTEVIDFHVFWYPNADGYQRATITLLYDVEFYDPNRLGSSVAKKAEPKPRVFAPSFKAETPAVYPRRQLYPCA